MKKIIIVALAAAGLVVGVSATGFASDWDKAGKALAIIEGVRVITGGNVDLIGTITGINRPAAREVVAYRGPYQQRGNDHRYYGAYGNYQQGRDFHQYRLVWVPDYAWREQFVPAHTEYRNGCQVFVQAHYERSYVEVGGHWEKVYNRY